MAHGGTGDTPKASIRRVEASAQRLLKVRRMTKERIQVRLIRTIVAAALAPVACGGSTSDGGAVSSTVRGDAGGTDAGPVLRAGFAPLACDGRGRVPLTALTATPAFDYVELRRQDGYNEGNQGTPARPDDVFDQTGTLCKTATDDAACKSAFAALQQPDKSLVCDVPLPCDRIYLATTRGDVVKSYLQTKDDLGPIAAPIDTAEEAAFVVAWSRALTCTAASSRATADGWDVAFAYDTESCALGKSEHHEVLVHVAKDGKVTQLSDDVTPLPGDPPDRCLAVARRASGVAYESACIVDAGDWLANAAHLEAASVGSFARLARELAAYGAPDELVRRVAAAARDERRHAQQMRSLARAAGKTVRPAPRVPRVVRSLEEIALENAIEGSARESWGAVVVRHQALCAEAPEVRAAFDAIADDEASHAELAADVAAWLASRLDPTAVARVHAAREATVATLARGAAHAMPERIRRPLGLPARDVSVRLFEGARRELFA